MVGWLGGELDTTKTDFQVFTFAYFVDSEEM